MLKKIARTKTILIIYVFVLAFIIFLADYKSTAYLLGFVGAVPFGDKIGHFFLMGGFSFLLNAFFAAKTFKLWKVEYLIGSCLVFLLVAIEEFSQIFISGRSFDWGDLIFDLAGILILGELARIVYRRRDSIEEVFAKSP